LEVSKSAEDDRGVIYLLTGPSHAVRLAVSIWSLRKHYPGPITVYTTCPESHVIGKLLAADSRLNVRHEQVRAVESRKNSSFLTKVALLPNVPYRVGVYLDADTLVAGSIEPLLESAAKHEFCATRFADWVTTGRTLRHRIERWRSVEGPQFDRQQIDEMIEAALKPQPAVNGGVFGFRKDAQILAPWYELAYTGRATFICDEIALQLLLPHYAHELLDCRFNCSPIHAGPRDDVRIWHFHGEKHVRREACRQLWLPMYEECLAENIAGIHSWTPCGDRRLESFLAVASQFWPLQPASVDYSMLAYQFESIANEQRL
jgi:hypothetical protein